MDYQQPHGFQRPPHPHPSAADPYQRPPHPVPPPPSNHPWPYPATQFQYQPQNHHSPSPPPPQWPPPPHSSDHTQYPLPPPPPYPTPPYASNLHYPPPHQLPPRPPQFPNSYSQDWASGSWNHHQSWQYPTNKNEEDWAAKARAWASAKAATDNMHGQSQFIPAGKPEELTQFHDQYSQSTEPQFLDGHAPPSTLNYNQFAVSGGPPSRTNLGHLQDPQYINSGQSSFAADTCGPFASRDGNQAGESVSLFPQEKSPMNSLVHQQEVPSSYSSVAGNKEPGDRYEKLNSSGSLLQHHIQPLPPSVGRTRWMEEPHNLLGSQPDESAIDLSNQPLKFAPHFNRDMDPHFQPNYSHSSGGPARVGDATVALPSNYSWSPSAPGAGYPQVPPTMPPGPQADHPIVMPSTTPGLSAPVFPAGPGFQPTVPMIGTAFGVGPGVTHHPTAFSGDAYGTSERPKKASVPNWLREEIIKKKAVITSSAPGTSKDDSQSIEEDSNEKLYRKGDQADSKSIDSSRSTEDEDEDEDAVEAARTAAINQEIKRVLTEVLLKVTDELFNEIATNVLEEDDLSVEVGRGVDMSSNHQLSSAQNVLTPRASAKVLIPTKNKDSDEEKLTSGSPGDVLGLGSYASDEEDEEIQSSEKGNSRVSSKYQQMSSNKVLEGNPVLERKHEDVPTELDSDSIVGNTLVSPDPSNTNLSDNREATELAYADDQHSSKRLSSITEDELQQTPDISKSNNFMFVKDVERIERRDGYSNKRILSEDSESQSLRNRSDKNNQLENERSSVKKGQELGSPKERLDRGDEGHKRRGRTDRIDYHDALKVKGKEKSRTDEKVKSGESGKRRSPAGRGRTTEARHNNRTGEKDDDRRQGRTGHEKKEQSRHKSGSEASGHKHHSSSGGVKARENKDKSVVSRANNSSEESSDDATRKSHHSKRRKSPSPVRSRKRHVSRSPHSKHSKRRHSPYSSLESSRVKRSSSRSRSRSPVSRRR